MSFGGMQEAIKKAQALQSEIAKIQNDLDKAEVEGISGGGLVKYRCTCKGDPISLSIDDQLSGDMAMVADLVIAAIKNAKENSDNKTQELMNEVTKKYGIDPSMLGKMPF